MVLMSHWQCVIINSDGTLIKGAGLFINSSLNYKTSPSEKPGQGGFSFAFWQLLHYITVQSIDRDARIGILHQISYTLRLEDKYITYNIRNIFRNKELLNIPKQSRTYTMK